MKRIYTLLIISLTILPLLAVYQDNTTAQVITENFLDIKDKNYPIIDQHSLLEGNKELAYVFTLDPQGFVLVPADNDIYPVLAYSFTNNFPENNGNENPFQQITRTDIKLRKDYYSQNGTLARENHKIWNDLLTNSWEPRDSRDFQQWPAEGSTITDGWVLTRWNQSGIYNDFCPLDNSGERSVVGCVATAMAMIIDFHGSIGDVTFTNSDDYYSGGGGHIDNDHEERDFPTFSDLNSYLSDLSQHYTNEETITATDMAALSFACGVSVEMWYSSDGSGAYTSDVAYELTNKFNFDTAEWVDNNDQTFYDQLSNEMINMRPAEMSIYTSGWNNGHAIICDGYNTDDYYHLNYGWGTSNSTCWYSLPYGMPSNYSIIGGAVMNIEGGEVPIATQGVVNVSDTSPIGTYITLEGEDFYEFYVTSADGSFEFPAVYAGNYMATAVLEDSRLYYESKNVYIDENDHFIEFNLGDYDAVNGIVTAPIAAQNTHICLYQSNELLYSGIADAGGNYSIPNVLPGIYTATASLMGNYFERKQVEISLDNQTVDFNLEDYEGNLGLAYSKHPEGIFSLIPDFNLICAVKLTQDEMNDMNDDVISGIRFKAPIDDSEGDIFAQVWHNNDLLSEKEISSFSSGEWIASDYDAFIPLDFYDNYYVGYKILSETGDIVFHDNGPRITQKGAFLRTSSWIELPSSYDFNFCIEAIIISQEFASVSGNTTLDGGDGNLADISLKADNFISHPDESGYYELDLKPGSYNIQASLIDYETVTYPLINIGEGEESTNIDFNIPFDVEVDGDYAENDPKLLGNFPNPFRTSTTISFSTREQAENTEISIYNLKGQKVRSLPVNPGNDFGSVIWNGRNENAKIVSSGIYFYKLKVDNRILGIKKMILVK